MYAASALIARLSSLPAYGSYAGILVDYRNRETWRCDHVHNFSSTATDCAEYERQKRMRGSL